MVQDFKVDPAMANSGRSVPQRSFRYYVALVLASALLFSSLTMSTKAQKQPDSKSLDAILSLLKEADALAKDPSVRAELKQASEATVRALKGGDGSKEVAQEIQTVRKLLRRIADDPRGESSGFREKITDALKLAQDSSANGDVAASDKMAGNAAEASRTMTTQQPGASQQQADISTNVQEGVRRAQEDSARRAQGQAAATIRTLRSRGAIAAGANHTCALVSGGEVRCWGNNEFGQLGDGTTTDASTPVAVTGLSGATAIAAGGAHTCALVSGGEVRCWGQNNAGQLGNGTTTNASTPVAVSGLSGATAIAAGHIHTCALVSGGEMRCWGANNLAQLGTYSIFNYGMTPTPVLYLSVSQTMSNLSGATAIAAGWGHTCALVSGGEVRCWGYNNDGQLGAGIRAERWMVVAGYGLSGATAIAAGGVHTCALVSGGEVRCWGNNENGQLGTGTPTKYYIPVAVPGISGVTAIAAGQEHTCALVSGGEMRCWGNNQNGQLGTVRLGGTYYIPVAVTGLSGATAIAAGDNHTCALVSGGEVRCWGNNQNGQLGNGTTTSHSTPVAVIGL